METETASFLKTFEHDATIERINRYAWMLEAEQNGLAAPRPAVRGGFQATLASIWGLLVGRALAPAR